MNHNINYGTQFSSVANTDWVHHTDAFVTSSLPVPQAALRLSDLRALLSSIRFRSLQAIHQKLHFSKGITCTVCITMPPKNTQMADILPTWSCLVWLQWARLLPHNLQKSSTSASLLPCLLMWKRWVQQDGIRTGQSLRQRKHRCWVASTYCIFQCENSWWREADFLLWACVPYIGQFLLPHWIHLHSKSRSRRCGAAAVVTASSHGLLMHVVVACDLFAQGFCACSNSGMYQKHQIPRCSTPAIDFLTSISPSLEHSPMILPL